ncbi:unnamed protein product [Mycena citricolor]|uniref:60S acidic ribosomal protein P1 n=1 Tax=Mycena citricolor TaxID=2018698 RepID=A0AAD2Q0X1_9AGAR|nr:unnamed protein product [Mycena citricolor]
MVTLRHILQCNVPEKTSRQSSDLAATYAALILADADVDHTAEKILTLTTAANIELEPIWATLLAKTLEGKNVKEMLSAVGTAAGPVLKPDIDARAADESNVEQDLDPADGGEGNDTDSDSDGVFGSISLFD